MSSLLISAAAQPALSVITPTAGANTSASSASSNSVATSATAAAATETTSSGTTAVASSTTTSSTSSSSSSSSGGAWSGASSSSGGGGGGVSVASSLSELLSSYSFKVGDKSYVSSVSSSDGEYTATVAGIGSASGSSVTAAENAIANKVNVMA